jgi:hypothetical protein
MSDLQEAREISLFLVIFCFGCMLFGLLAFFHSKRNSIQINSTTSKEAAKSKICGFVQTLQQRLPTIPNIDKHKPLSNAYWYCLQNAYCDYIISHHTSIITIPLNEVTNTGTKLLNVHRNIAEMKRMNCIS